MIIACGELVFHLIMRQSEHYFMQKYQKKSPLSIIMISSKGDIFSLGLEGMDFIIIIM